MKATICDKCKEITANAEQVRYEVGKKKFKGELCEKCVKKLLGFFDTGAQELIMPPTKPAKTIEKPVAKPQPLKSLRDIELVAAQSEQPAAIGFMYMKCPVCGEVRGFNAKQEREYFHCSECNTDSPLGNLVDLYARCECGKTWHYVTNMTDEMFDMPCLNCGNPMPIRFNAKSGAYETIRN